MQVEFLGHAGSIITFGKMRVACDPWLSPRGAFHASWFQFPCNHHLWERDYRDLAAVVITHEQQDHLVCRLLLEKKKIAAEDVQAVKRAAPLLPANLHFAVKDIAEIAGGSCLPQIRSNFAILLGA